MTDNGTEVLISIRGTQNSGADSDSIELMTRARLVSGNGVTEIIYDEPDGTGLDATTTNIRVESQNVVTITRTGNIASQLVLEKGRRHLNHYETGFGQLVLGVSTSSIRNRLSDAGGDLSVSYCLEMNSSLISKNRFYLKIVGETKTDDKSGKICN